MLYHNLNLEHFFGYWKGSLTFYKIKKDDKYDMSFSSSEQRTKAYSDRTLQALPDSTEDDDS
ncbi:hypothetical protein GCM10010912_67220 [Paenibacillus albidus]|uniref:Uncharacterized protein n=1 Tax=Paenibacillus albidus TaxID=2041023 RepID=A0A917FX64_9BACL|nr:hypothetical protein GCM10010912_67220 [Paenibacillus albidus]